MFSFCCSISKNIYIYSNQHDFLVRISMLICDDDFGNANADDVNEIEFLLAWKYH